MDIITRPYEILIRWNPDGSISGAHIGRLKLAVGDSGAPVLTPEGSLELAQILPVEPLDHAGPEMVAILGELPGQITAQLTAAQADLEAVKADLGGKLAKAQASNTDLASKLNGATSTIQELRAQVAALTAKSAPAPDPAL